MAEVLTKGLTKAAWKGIEPVPCPFCGSDKTEVVHTMFSVRYAVRCLGCEAIGPKTPTAITAVEAWVKHHEVALKDPQRIPITAAKRIAEQYGYEQVVVYARRTGEGGKEHMATYGTTKPHCGIAAKMAATLQKFMGWNIT